MPASTRLLAGRYRLDLLVGEGGAGSVWRAHDERLGRDVAVKVVRPDAADPAAVARFDREARVVAALRHPGVVLVHDYGVEDGSPFLVMELLPGPSLARVLAEEAPLDVDRAVGYVREAADALAAAHAAGVVHRDVKPGNLVLDAEGRIRVVDFGLAHVEREADAGLTAAGHVVGSAAYLAPEQASGGPVDARADLYALGCVLVALLTGRPPFTGDSPVAVALQHLHAEPPDLRVLRPDVSEPVALLVADLLQKDQARRPSGGAEVVTRLRLDPADAGATAVLPTLDAADRDAPAPPPGPRHRLGRRVGTERLVLLSLVGLLVAAVALGLVLGLVPRGGGSGADDAAPASPEPVAEESVAEPEPVPEPAPAQEPAREPPAEPAPADPVTALAALREAVAAVEGEGRERGARRDLERRVERVESALRDGDTARARDRVDDLQKEVEGLVDGGRVPAAGGQAVLDAAAVLLATLPAEGDGSRSGDRDDRDGEGDDSDRDRDDD